MILYPNSTIIRLFIHFLSTFPLYGKTFQYFYLRFEEFHRGQPVTMCRDNLSEINARVQR